MSRQRGTEPSAWAFIVALFTGDKLISSPTLIKLVALMEKLVSQKAGPEQTVHDRFCSKQQLHFNRTIRNAETRQPDVGKVITGSELITEGLLIVRIANDMRLLTTSVAHRPKLQASLRTNTIARPKSSSPKLKSNESDRRADTKKAEAVNIP